ncbi:chaplin [Streptomyces sp. NPDC059917]|uniref:chaplin n=1 Tax=Streptomyces sp. NPDC059917 TaxID=3347002 RepID=UPI003659E526
MGTTRRSGATHGAVAYATSAGTLAENVVQIPIHIPINVCGNSIGIVSVLNPAFGNTCINA